MRPPERGIALITALLVVALATLAATALLSSSSLAIHRTASLRDSEQGWWVARGVESWVLGILQKDAAANKYDALSDDWAVPVDNLPVDHGHVRGRVVDLQGRYNLNNAVLDKVNEQAYRTQLDELIRGLTLQTPAPPGLAGAILDWADEDQNPRFPGGAEDSVYLGLIPPYRAANRPFTVVSELRAVHGVTPEIYDALAPLVSALPKVTRINVNTADVQVLRALSTSANVGKLEQFIQTRVDQPAREITEFNNTGALGGEAAPYIATTSEYFQIQGEVFVGSSRVALYSLVHRPTTGAPTVLAHAADAE
ncbi:MAG TPA: type II secretion system minor pseudopilin GspK [Verrucomicrobiae bacterium]|nr:type II secretion system minor pseudopilin GspK [Verrucomicrobiae bacterium]